MTDNNSCCIVVPVYRPVPTDAETASLRQAITILGEYPIVLLCGATFDMVSYRAVFEQAHFSNYTVSRFSDRYFASINGYNQLLLSLSFYRHFRSYSHLLIYQLDAWVFANHLTYWCHQPYDYIGAPWFEGFNDATPNAALKAVGNGGLSLRRVQACIKVLTSFSVIRPRRQLWKTFVKEITPRSALAYLLRMTVLNNTFFLMNDYNFQEDHFWGIEAAKNFNWYRVPDPLTASRFATEINPERLYRMNGYELPFGCHAWEKYEPDFWRNFIPA